MTDGTDGIIRESGGNTSTYSDGFDSRDAENGNSATGTLEISSTSAARIRRGGRCCGCCCDYRRAVIILDIILWLSSLLGMIYAIAAEEHLIKIGIPREDADDDTSEAAFDEFMADSTLLKYGIVSEALLVFIFLPMSVYGAFRFRWSFVIPLCVWVVANEFFNAIFTAQFCSEWQAQQEQDSGATNEDGNQVCNVPPFLYVLRVVQVLLILYPHVVFARQCRKGILTLQTYHSAEKSCCCST